MKEEIKQLTDLQTQVAETWNLLDIDAQKKELADLESKMQTPDFWDDQEKAAAVGKQHESLRAEIETWTKIKEEIEELLLLSKDLESTPDTEMQTDLEKRIGQLQKQYEDLEFFVLMDGKYDKKNAILSFNAGSGGTEAQDWTEMILRMITRYAEKKDWSVTLLDESKGSEAGIKSATLRIEGRYAYGHLKSEHGTHRLVRISPFDAEKMRHTSFASIEVIPEIEQTDLEVKDSDLRIDTYMSSGKGGQSVNTTYSAVRIVHIPTGIMVQCQNEKSQLQNKQTAMKILLSRLQKKKDEEEEVERLKLRGEHKSAEWGNQIRSYVLHPYKMVKDVRTKYEESNPDEVLDGKLDAFVEAYLKWSK